MVPLTAIVHRAPYTQALDLGVRSQPLEYFKCDVQRTTGCNPCILDYFIRVVLLSPQKPESLRVKYHPISVGR